MAEDQQEVAGLVSQPLVPAGYVEMPDGPVAATLPVVVTHYNPSAGMFYAEHRPTQPTGGNYAYPTRAMAGLNPADLASVPFPPPVPSDDDNPDDPQPEPEPEPQP